MLHMPGVQKLARHVEHQQRLHAVEREPLPQLDPEEVGQADRVTEQGASGRLLVRLSRCRHVANDYHSYSPQ